MDIYFDSGKLQKLCDSEKKLIKKFGFENAQKIKLRLVQLEAAEHLAGMAGFPDAHCHRLHGELEGYFSVYLKHPMRLIFKPSHDPMPVKADGGLDLYRVTMILITDIRDYH